LAGHYWSRAPLFGIDNDQATVGLLDRSPTISQLYENGKSERVSELIDPRQQGPEEAGFAEIIPSIGASWKRAMQAVNTALIDLYWQIGEIISRRVAAA